MFLIHLKLGFFFPSTDWELKNQISMVHSWPLARHAVIWNIHPRNALLFSPSIPHSFLTRTQRWQKRAAASSVWCRKRSISSSGQGCDIWPQGFNERLCVSMWGARPIGHERARSFTPMSPFGRWKMASSRPNSLWICMCVCLCRVPNHLHNPVPPTSTTTTPPRYCVWESLSLC